MIKHLSAALWVLLLFLGASSRLLAAPGEVTVLSYHEISEPGQALAADYAVAPAMLAAQLDWLKRNGYRFVSLDDVLADRAGKRPLPDKAVLLTFDDGYRSVYTQAFPLLKQYRAPALIALVGSWLEEQGSVDFDGRAIPRRDLLSWNEIRTMRDSGLVEVASHSYALHRGINANPQGNQEPAATAREYVPAQGRYEDEKTYAGRVLADLRRNSALIRRELGRAPRAMVWPYGAHNAVARAMAAKVGMPVTFNLDDGPNLRSVPLDRLRRVLVDSHVTLPVLARELDLRTRNVSDNDRAAKIMHVDLDNIYDADPAQQERNLGLLLDRIQLMGVNTVYLQAFSDPDGNGSADALYFPNRHLPMRADLFNRVVWQISTRTRVKRVYAWMPMLAFELPAGEPAAKDLVETQQNNPDHLVMGYHRLSPFSPRARQVIRDIYEDLSRSVAFQGLLFHDDVTLSDYEDAGPRALAAYRAWGLPQPLAEIRGDDALLQRWTARKIALLDDFAAELGDIVRREQPDLKLARNLYAQVALNPYSSTWYAQSLADSVRHYDFTAIMAMPYMEQAADHQAFYRDMVARVKAVPGAMDRVVFELQATDWRTGQRIPTTEIADTVRMLYGLGARHVGYYPDNLFQGHPDPAILRPVFDSKSSLPEQ